MSVNQSATIRIALSGVAAVTSGLEAVQRQTTKLETATAGWGAAAEETNKRGFLMNQMLFTMRRYAYAATLGITGLATASVAMGIKFNASMESNRVAFTQFLGSTQKANTELQYLYHLAAYTPFEFTNVTDAARRFLAFGYTLDQTNASLKVIGDTVAAFGGGGAEIERMVTVFGQIRASGRLLGQDLLQLEQQGVPAIDILTEKLAKYGITRAMLSKPGSLQIPSSIGIPALLSGLQERFGGASAIQARTFTGQLSTLHDLFSQVMGGLTLASFTHTTRGLLPAVNKMFTQMSQLTLKQKGKISLSQVFDIAERDFPKLAPLLKFIKLLMDYFQLFGRILVKDILPPLGFLVWVLSKTLYPALVVVLWALKLVTKYAVIAIPLFLYLGGLFAWGAWQAWQAAKAEGALAKTRKFLHFWTEAVTKATRALIWTLNGEGLAWVRLRLAILLSALALWWETKVANTATWAQVRLTLATIMATLSMGWFKGSLLLVRAAITKVIQGLRILAAALLELIIDNPILLLVAAVVLLITGLVILYFKWKWFHNLVNTVAKYVWEHWKRVAIILVIFGGLLGLQIALLLVVARNYKLIWGWVMKVWDAFMKMWNWIKSKWPLVKTWMLAPFEPMILGVQAVIVTFEALISAIQTAIGWVKSLVNWIGKIKIPGWGFVKRVAGAAWSGFKQYGLGINPKSGPVAAANGAASALPLVSGGGAIPVPGEDPIMASVGDQKKQIGKNPMHVTTHTVINVDGKKMAENSTRHKLNALARR